MHISASIGGLNRVSQKSKRSIYRCQRGATMGDTTNINQHQPTSASMDIYGWLKTCCLTNIHLHIPTSRTPIIPLRCWPQPSPRSKRPPSIIRPSNFSSDPTGPCESHWGHCNFRTLKVKPWTAPRHRRQPWLAMMQKGRCFMETTQELRIQQSKMASAWWFQPTPLKNDGVFVSWDYDIPAIYGKSFKSHVPVTTNKWLVWPLTNSLKTQKGHHCPSRSDFFLQYQPPNRQVEQPHVCCKKLGFGVAKKKNTNGFSPTRPRNSSEIFCHPGTTPVKLGVGVQGSNDGGEKNLAVLAGQLGELQGWSLSPQFGRHKSSGVGGSALSLWWSKSDSIEE